MESYHKNGELNLKESPLQGRQKHVIIPAYSVLGHCWNCQSGCQL